MQTPVSLLSPLGFSYYARTQILQPEFYQGLIDRGWRRSGSLLYKPDLRDSCCPQHTIRLDSHQFHATKDQRQVLNRFNRYILGDTYTKETARLYPKSREQAKKRNTDFDLLERIHEGEKEQIKTPPEPAHSFTVTLELDDFTEEKFALFENYQRIVHHEPPNKISKQGFKNFLCSSPISRSTQTIDGKTKRLGSYHQCYRLDGKLIAMGVLDLLPQCISAVYFMYHESVHSHGFGKLGALREIALAKEDGYQYWYAGFYIHSCVKMRYKGDYSPQYFLDPETYSWILFDENLRGKLDARKYVSEKQEDSKSDQGPEPKPTTQTPCANLSDLDEDDEDDDVRTPIFQSRMPGLLSTTDLQTKAPLDNIKIRIGRGDVETRELVLTHRLVGWETGVLTDMNSLKGIIAELVSAVGVRLAGVMEVYF
ncbi:hypothetical protein SBOR_5645 [Sclerotinia borealis F-4128]|uniref:arginyltransferase n=1 Tax=Sclerotinia borealis (strain F-4128) TaxID=1432307 RepID=W9CB20_SCLBF|nr:hypothetical protein SBOR_5645 [Sclerotinia borealis F-4128]